MRELEEYFKDAAAELREHHLSTLPENPPAHTFSHQFERDMHRMIERERLQYKGARFAAFARQAAGFILAATLSLSACIVSVGAWGDQFFEMLEQKYPEYTRITFTQNGKSTRPTAPLTYELTYIPDGFRRVEHANSPSGFLNHAFYENEATEKMLTFSQSPAEGIAIALNTEGAELESVQLSFGAVRLLENRGMCNILWNDDQYCYTITTSLPRDETIKLAEGVRLKARPYPSMQQLPIESLPEQYSEDLARQGGDIVFYEGQATETPQRLTDFITACDNKKTDVIRLVSYVGVHARIYDLETQDGRIYFTRDEHRWTDSEQPWTAGEEFDGISILEGGGKKVLLLHTRRYSVPVKVLEF